MLPDISACKAFIHYNSETFGNIYTDKIIFIKGSETEDPRVSGEVEYETLGGSEPAAGWHTNDDRDCIDCYEPAPSMPLLNDDHIQLNIYTDAMAPEHNSMYIQNNSTGEMVYELPLGQMEPSSEIEVEGCVDLDDCHELVILDQGGDGICCSTGQGTWSMLTTTSEGDEAAYDSPTNGQFGNQETQDFGCTSSEKASIKPSAALNAPVQVAAFPNPFSSSTTIRFVLEQDDYVSIEVYGLNGTRVATLFTAAVQAGVPHAVELNGNHLGEGIYFYQLTTTNGVTHRDKLVLLR